jgi:CheY-like chemotaxis protein
MKVPNRILLIDDDPDDQLFFRDAVQVISPGLRCELTSGFMEAIKQLELPPLPDFIFMDLNMPVMNGFDCLDYLKTQIRYKDIPLIIFSTSKNLNDINRTKQLGAEWFLTKPDDFNELCKKLKKIIQKETVDGIYMI